MNKEEAIKYLRQLYPNGGHCWLDEQRIEAIGMAIKALQEEPVSEDFTKALAECIHKAQCSVVDPLAHADVWKEELVKLAKCEEPVSEAKDIFDNCLKSDEKFILPQKISGNINCENCLYSSACALGDIPACIIDKHVSEDLLSKVDKQAKCIWDEINTGHEYSIIDSYNQFYGICMQIAESIKEEPLSEDLEEASKEWLRPQLDKSYANYGETKMMELTHFDGYAMLDAIEFGAKWQKEHLWKHADGNDLPEYEREVVVFTQNFPDDAGMMMVAIGHRPNPDGWDGKSLSTGKVEHYTPKTYDKGGWNIPNVKYWLDCLIPKEIEL